jgi:uncharacterized membrane protein
MPLLQKYENAAAVTIHLLKLSGKAISPEKVIAELDKHPDYPSLLAISDILHHFRIENAAYRIPTEDVENVPCPFIAQTHINGGDFIVVHKITEGHVFASSDKWNNHRLILADFKKTFNGVVLSAQRAYLALPVLYTRINWSAYKTPGTITGFLLLFLVALFFKSAYIQTLNWQVLLLTLFKTVGLITAVLLLIQSIDGNNPLIQKLCKSGSKTDCNAIQSSKAAKVFDGLSWSEVGFFYFAGTWLLLLFGGGSNLVWLTLIILNLISLPYTFYSIYYQAKIAKQWCVLCCAVQALLWLEALTGLTLSKVEATIFNFRPLTFGASLAVAATVLICLLLPILLWILIKPFILQLQQIPILKKQLRKFKYNVQLFSTLLNNQARYSTPDEEWSIVLGNVEAGNIITMVSNPYCPPCGKVHEQLDSWLSENDNIQARIVFTANNTDDDIKTPVTRHLMALNNLPDKTIVRNALHDWYAQKHKNYEAWAKIYPVEFNETEFNKIDKQNAWCKMAEVTATPTMLLNGYRLPDFYQLTDLTYMLE